VGAAVRPEVERENDLGQKRAVQDTHEISGSTAATYSIRLTWSGSRILSLVRRKEHEIKPKARVQRKIPEWCSTKRLTLPVVSVCPVRALCDSEKTHLLPGRRVTGRGVTLVKIHSKTCCARNTEEKLTQNRGTDGRRRSTWRMDSLVQNLLISWFFRLRTQHHMDVHVVDFRCYVWALGQWHSQHSAEDCSWTTKSTRLSFF